MVYIAFLTILLSCGTAWSMEERTSEEASSYTTPPHSKEGSLTFSSDVDENVYYNQNPPPDVSSVLQSDEDSDSEFTRRFPRPFRKKVEYVSLENEQIHYIASEVKNIMCRISALRAEQIASQERNQTYNQVQMNALTQRIESLEKVCKSHTEQLAPLNQTTQTIAASIPDLGNSIRTTRALLGEKISHLQSMLSLLNPHLKSISMNIESLSNRTDSHAQDCTTHMTALSNRIVSHSEASEQQRLMLCEMKKMLQVERLNTLIVSIGFSSFLTFLTLFILAASYHTA